MPNPHNNRPRVTVLTGLTSIGTRMAGVTMRPLSGVAGVAAGAGLSLERRAVDRLLVSGELEQLLASARLHALVELVLESDGAKGLVDTAFDSGMFERLVDRLLASDALWRLVDVIAESPAVRAAIAQQGLGFADQVGEQVRGRSRRADDWLERSARRLVHRQRDSRLAVPRIDE